MIADFLKRKIRLPDVVVLMLFLLVTAFYAIASVPFLTGSANVDSQVYNLGGKILAEGGILYKDYFDHKGPALYLLNEFGYVIGGVEWGMWLIDLALVFVAMLILYRGVRVHLDLVPAFLVSVAALFFYDSYLANKPEFYYLIAMTVSLGLVLRSDDEKTAVISGLMASSVFFMKQTLIGYFVVLFLHYLLSVKSNRRRLICYCGAGLLASAAFLLYLLSKGIIWEYYNCCFKFNMLYCNENSLVWNGFDLQILSESLIAFGWAVGSPGVLATFLACLILVAKRKYRLLMLGMVFWLWEAFFVFRTGRFYFYQFVGLNFASSVAFLVLLGFIRTAKVDFRKRLYLIVFVMFGYSLCNMLFDGNLKRVRILMTGILDENSQNDEMLVAQIKSLPEGPLLIWGSKCSVYYRASRQGFSRYYYRTPLDIYGGISDAEADAIIRDLSRRDDVVIVDSASEPILRPIPHEGRNRHRKESRFRRLLADVVNREFVDVESTVPGVRIFVKRK